MKRILSALTSVSLIFATSSLVVSCRHSVYNQGLVGERLLVVTDAGSIADHSFNEQIYRAILEYSNRPYTPNGGGFDFEERYLSAQDNWVQPLKSDYESYVNSYKLAHYKGTDIYVLSGFQQEMSRFQAAEIAGPEKTIIVVDSATPEPTLNAMHLSFNSQLAGFSAAYDSAVWATSINPDTGMMRGQVYPEKPNLSFGTYAGISNKDSTGSYLWGFLVGMAYFNARVAQENQNNRHLNLANFGVNGEVSGLKGIQSTDNRFFTGSFESGGANRSGVNDLLGPNGGKADLIFPVAGIQILDTLTANRRAYIVGVDTNQSLQFPEYGHRFVTSAMKDIKMALFDGFDHSKANRLNHQIIEGELGPLIDTGPAQGEFWEGTIPTPNNAWSHDIDMTTATEGTKIPHTLVDFAEDNRDMADLLNQFFKATGPGPQDFLSWSGEYGIEAIVNQLLALGKLPLTFDNSVKLNLNI